MTGPVGYVVTQTQTGRSQNLETNLLLLQIGDFPNQQATWDAVALYIVLHWHPELLSDLRYKESCWSPRWRATAQDHHRTAIRSAASPYIHLKLRVDSITCSAGYCSNMNSLKLSQQRVVTCMMQVISCTCRPAGARLPPYRRVQQPPHIGNPRYAQCQRQPFHPIAAAAGNHSVRRPFHLQSTLANRQPLPIESALGNHPKAITETVIHH